MYYKTVHITVSNSHNVDFMDYGKSVVIIEDHSIS